MHARIQSEPAFVSCILLLICMPAFKVSPHVLRLALMCCGSTMRSMHESSLCPPTAPPTLRTPLCSPLSLLAPQRAGAEHTSVPIGISCHISAIPNCLLIIIHDDFLPMTESVKTTPQC